MQRNKARKQIKKENKDTRMQAGKLEECCSQESRKGTKQDDESKQANGKNAWN